MGHSPWGCKESETERLHFHFHLMWRGRFFMVLKDKMRSNATSRWKRTKVLNATLCKVSSIITATALQVEDLWKMKIQTQMKCLRIITKSLRIIKMGGGGLVSKSCLTLAIPWTILCPWDFQGKNAGGFAISFSD